MWKIVIKKSMGYTNIMEKLNTFLIKQPLKGEEDVVYLLVEIRKVIKQNGLSKKYPILKFYCDWSVHSEKDAITPEIKMIMENIYQEIILRVIKKVHVIKPNTLGFIDMKHLRPEMDKFLKENGLPDSLTVDSKNWTSFQIFLAGVLVDQPIKNPCKGIKEYSYKLTGKPRVTKTEATFEKRPAEYGIFQTEESFN